METSTCVTCHTAVLNATTCFRCGCPVHWQEPDCGGWILDWWHPMAFDEDDGNEFWCQACLDKGLEDEGKTAYEL